MPELVSVIIRTVNRPSLLREAIQSVAAQDHVGIELIVANDGGSDFGTLVAQEAVGAIVRHRVLQCAAPHGRSRAANAGLEACTGTFICFLDDDDWMLPHHVSTLLAALSHTDAPAAYGIVESVRLARGREVLLHRFDSQFNAQRLGYLNLMPIHSVLFRRLVVDRGCRFVSELELFEDWNFWIQVSKYGDFIHVPTLIAKYRVGDDSGIGLPSTQRDISSGFQAFVESTRNTWTTAQLEHLCRAGLAAERLSDSVNLQARQLELASQKRQQSERLRNELQRALDASRMELDAQRAEHQLAKQNWDAQVRALLSSRSWKLARIIQLPHRVLRVALRAANKARQCIRTEGASALSRSTYALWRREGLPGLRSWLLQPVSASHTQELAGDVAGADTSAITLHAHIVRATDGTYRLTSHHEGYCYVPLAPPTDLRTTLDNWENPPLLSIVVPVYNTPPGLLEALVASVRAQWYPHWELVLVNDASPDPDIAGRLTNLADERVRVGTLTTNSGISTATNVAADLARGAFLVFADHDDLLTPDCLYELALRLRSNNVDFVYSDEDKIDANGCYTDPHFKPDWSPDAMMSTMFTGHVSALRHSLFDELGGLRSEVDGCQDWDLVLRVTEKTSRIAHIPRVLYHWRTLPQSIATDIAAKPYVIEATQRVRRDALARRGLNGYVEPVPQVLGYFRVNYCPQGEPLVSIIIPTRNRHELVMQCVESIERLSRWRRYEIVIVDNGSDDPDSMAAFAALHDAGRARVVRDDRAFNFSALCNRGRAAAAGQLLLFLNNDTEVQTPDWLERMIGYAQLAHVGAVGAKLLYANGSVQHAGILNLEDGPMHAFLRSSPDAPGYYMRNLLEYDWIAVTGACLMIETEKFDSVGGFDETFPVAYNDVELCLRLVAQGLFNVVCQSVRLTHYESLSRGQDDEDAARRARLNEDRRRLYSRHPRFFENDPFFNANLHPCGFNFDLLN